MLAVKIVTMKKYRVFIISLIVLYSCDVRRKDKIADDGAMLSELALKDSTEVQLIDSDRRTVLKELRREG